ncbi:hypothetical protein EV662_11075 [Rhodovulum marinum]|uniref:Uncharacterized protein n=1 Tax=Rhodovulum marinum TaxID=320662 RepID=A0A4R2PUW4_9RHOB|nr:hypothetical protein EV662_11075 [Rhodovulum marinum]
MLHRSYTKRCNEWLTMTPVICPHTRIAEIVGLIRCALPFRAVNDFLLSKRPVFPYVASI